MVTYVDATALNDFLRCRKYYYYRHIKHLIPAITPAPLSFGKVWHEIGEKLAKGESAEAAKEHFTKNYKNETADAIRTPEKGVELIDGYVKKYKREPFKVLYTETSFTMVLPNDIVLCGKEDAIVEWNDEIYVFERKTTSRLGITFFEKFRHDYQIDIYCLACREIVGSCAGAIIDAIRVCKPKAKADVDFVRDVVGRTDRELDDAQKEVVTIVNDMRRNIIYKNKSACFAMGKCCYFPICQSYENPKVIRDLYKESVWNPTKGVEEVVKKMPKQQNLKF